MVGHVVYTYLNELNKYNIINVSFRTKLNNDSVVLNVKDIVNLENLIVDNKPDYIVNCIGILIKGSSDVENAIFVNSYLPHLLCKITKELSTKIIHISTDCVFSGKKGYYSETDFRDADDIYGRSKALGEINDNKNITIRTSVIGPELKKNGEGLFHWFMNQHGIINGFSNAYWGGVTTLELAKVIERLIEMNNFTGVFNLTNGEKISKYDLIILMKNIWRKNDVNIVKSENSKTIDKSLKTSVNINYVVKSYEEMLIDLFDYMNKYAHLYNQYDF